MWVEALRQRKDRIMKKAKFVLTAFTWGIIVGLAGITVAVVSIDAFNSVF